MAPLSPTFDGLAVYDSGKADYWDTQTMVDGATKVPTDPGTVSGSLVQVTWSRTEATGIREDVAMIDLHQSIATGVNSAWSRLDATDMAAFETAFDALWTTVKALVTDHWVLSGFVWRHFGADFPLGKTGLSKPGVIVRNTTRSVAGTLTTGYVPDQAALSVTFKTASRKHWGRVYLPPCNSTNVSSFSRFTSTYVDAVAGGFNTLWDTLTNRPRAQHTFVWSPKYRGMLSVDQLQVDNVPDVIRSRRPKVKTYAKQYG